MRIFTEIDPHTIDNDPRVVFVFEEYLEDINRSWFLYLLKDNDHFIWASKDIIPAKNGMPPELSGNSFLEFPVSGLQWFIETLEQKFFKTEAEGGLPKDQFSYDEIIDGEHLCVSRMFGTPGYGFRNYSRQDHVWEDDDDDDPQQADLSDELLFEKGLFEKFKEVAKQLAQSSPI